MYAIFETGGKQYKVEKGDIVFVEKLDKAENEFVTFDKVLFFADGKKESKIGTPYLTTVVGAKVLKQGKDKKITVFTYKPKKNEKRKLGHRQPYTKLEIIEMGTKAAVAKAFDEYVAPVKEDVKKSAEKAEEKKAETKKTEEKKKEVKKTVKKDSPAIEKKPAAKKTASTAKKPASTAKKPAATTKKATTEKKTAVKKEEAPEKDA